MSLRRSSSLQFVLKPLTFCRRAALVLLALLATACPAKAQIDFTAPVTASGDSDVNTAGTLISAYDQSNTAATVNGVTFSAGNSTTTLGTTFTLSGFTGSTFTGFGTGNGAPFSSLSSNYQTVLTGGAYANAGTNATVTLNSLTSGHQYAVQFWVDDSRAAEDTRTETISSTGGNTQTLAYNAIHAGGGIGQYSLGYFTASGASQVFNLLGNASTQINAIQLRDVTNIGYWQGTSSTWDQSTTTNFSTTTTGTPGTFAAAIAVLPTVYFGNSQTLGGAAVGTSTVNIASAGVSGADVFFINTSAIAYTLSTSGAVGIGGGANSVWVEGGGQVAFNSANTYGGGTYITSGGLTIANAGSLGSGAVNVGAAGTLNINVGAATIGNTLNGSGGIINVQGAGETRFSATSLSGFAGTLNVLTTSDPNTSLNAKMTLLATSDSPGSAQTINIGSAGSGSASTATLYDGGSAAFGSNVTINIYGAGNAEGFGALRLDNGSVAGAVTLETSNATIGEQGASTGNITGAIGGTGGLTKVSTGTLILKGANTYTGGTAVTGGAANNSTYSTLNLTFGTSGATLTNILYNGVTPGTLTLGGPVPTQSATPATAPLGGGNLTLTGGAAVTNSQTFNNLVLNPGDSAISATVGASGTINLALGAITTSTGGFLNFVLPATGSITTTTANAGTTGILGGYATVAGSNWAASAGTGSVAGPIGAYSSYTPVAVGGTIASGATTNVQLTGTGGAYSVGSGTTFINTLQYGATTTASTLTNSGTLVLGPVGGILAPSGGGGVRLTISGGTLSAGGNSAGPGELFLIANTSNNPTISISSNITDNPLGGAVSVIESGRGEVQLTGNNSYTGGTYINQGRLNPNSNSLGTGPIYIANGAEIINPGSLANNFFISGSGGNDLADGVARGAIREDGGATLTGAITLLGNAALGSAGTGTNTLSGAIVGDYALGINPSAGNAATWNFNGSNSYGGATLVDAGTVTANTLANGGLTIGLTTTSGAAAATLTSTTGLVNGTTYAVSSIDTAGGTTFIFSGSANVILSANAIASGTTNAQVGTANSLGLSSNAAGNLILGIAAASAFTYTGPTASTDRLFSVGTLGATINNNASSNGNLSFTNTGAMGFNLTSGTRALTFGGTSTGVTTLAAAIADNGGATSLTKNGSGTLALTGTSTYSGATTVSSGTLRLGSGGNLEATVVTVAAGATFAVNPGVIGATNSIASGGSLTLNTGATFTMSGDSATSTLTVGTATLNVLPNTSSLKFDIGGAPTASDTLAISGSATINGTGAVISISPVGTTALTPGSYNLITATSGLNNSSFRLSTGGSIANEITLGGTTSVVNLSASNTTLAVTVANENSAYWTGIAGSAWNAGLTNFNTTAAGATPVAALPTSATDVYFTTTAYTASNLTNTLAAPTTVNSLNFLGTAGAVTLANDTNSDALTINAGGLTVASGAAAQTVNVPVTLGNGQTWTNSSANVLTIGGAVTNGGYYLTTAGAGNIVLGGAISGAGGLVVSGTGTITLTNANTYTGATSIIAGALNIQNAGALGTGGGATSGVAVLSGGALQLQGGITTTTAVPLTLNGAGVTASPNGALENVSGNNTYSGLITLGSAATIGSDSGTLTLSNTGTITGATFGLTLTGAGNGSLASIIGTTTGTLAKSGTGTWTLSGANTFTGGTTLNAGTLNLNNATALGGAAGALTINGGTLNNTSGAAIIIANNNPVTLGGSFSFGTSVSNNLNNLNLGTGAVTNAGSRTITFNGTGTALTLGGTMTNTAGAIQTTTVNGMGNTLVLGAYALSNSATSFVDVINGTGNVMINGAVTNGGTATASGLTYSGMGTLRLNGANTYAGATTVSSGTLALGATGATGASLGATAVTVAGGGAFAVNVGSSGATTNALAGSLSLGAGSAFTMADGNTTTLNVTGASTLAPTTGIAPTLTFDLGTTANANDKLAITGTATVGAAGNMIYLNYLGGATAPTPGNYTVISASSGLGSGFTLGTTQIVAGTSTYALSLSGAGGTEVVTIGAGSGSLNQAYWTGANGAWNTALSSWATTAAGGTSVSSTPASGTDVFFSVTGASTNLSNTLGAAYTINSLNFTSDAGAVTITNDGNLLTINAGTAIASGPAVGITDASSNPQTVNEAIALGAAQSWSNTGTALLSLGGAINNNGNLLTTSTTAGGGDIAINGVLSGAGGLTATGTGTTTLSSVSNSYTGVTTVSGGTLSISADGAAAGNTGNLGTVPSSAAPGSLVLSGGTLATTANFTLNANRGILLTGANTLAPSSTTTLTYGGIIAGGGSLRLNGSGGTVALSGANTYTGGTTLTAGTLKFSSATALGTGTITFNGGTLAGAFSGTLSNPLQVNNVAGSTLLHEHH